MMTMKKTKLMRTTMKKMKIKDKHISLTVLFLETTVYLLKMAKKLSGAIK